jgi:hypothetical protein
MEKATFRLPEWELETMRERSRRERRSLNTVVAEVIATGLGRPPATAASRTPAAISLGSLLARPAKSPWDPRARRPVSPVQLTDALDWSRGDR